MTNPIFTVDRARSLPGADFLRDRRAAAAARFAETPLPTHELEEWRYSQIDDVDLGRYSLPAEPSEAAPPAELLALRDHVTHRAATVLIRSGKVIALDIDERLASAGLRVGRLAEQPEHASLLGSVETDPDAFLLLNEAFSADPVVIDVPAGLDVTEPIVIARWFDTDGGASFPRILVRSGAGASVRVVEWSGSSDVDGLVVPVVEVDAGDASRVGYLGVQLLGPRVTQLGRFASRVGQQATLEAGHVAFGGDYARMRFDCRLVGRGATGDLSALYLGGGTGMHDLRTFQDHDAADTTSDLLFKGAVDDESHAVYTGLIRISKQGRGSNATQSNRIVKLSPDAWAESVPNLEIEHNDVRCAHASAVGPIDADQRFYLESRGVPPEAAERLVVSGFFEEVLAKIEVPEVADRVRLELARRLGATS
ncbi:MAG TPA: SufD family Fe-S cluster assembly protein [Microthrixaceae bacterium]|nr:SufD family Fe-S cluster assembly protein [Microthrixaceae bacterium]